MSVPSTAALRAHLEQQPKTARTDLAQPLNTCDAATLIPLYQQLLEQAESTCLQSPLDTSLLSQLQQLYRELEQWITHSGADERHHFIITIPVAERPQQLERCLQSLHRLCEQFHYGRSCRGEYQKLTLLISDDSTTAAAQQAIQQITERFNQQGIESIYFGPREQQALFNQLSPTEQQQLQTLAPLPQQGGVHKGASTTRNLAYLKLAQLEQQRPEKLLFWFVDSDQEFRVNLSDGNREHELDSINYLYHFDRIFSQQGAVMVTGKLVGDPPVSPTVMANNLLLDLNHFLEQLGALQPDATCHFHSGKSQREGEAAYHDMTDLFGYPVPVQPYEYRCNQTGRHTHQECLQGFSQRLAAFFSGEHPTRRSYHQPAHLQQSIKPARTVYTANYLFTTEGLNAFIPFAALKLRMAGPMLGRLLEQRWGERFLSANLPMVHKRILEGRGHAEHRPGVEHSAQSTAVDLSGEFERQFYGDVMLFTLEQLVTAGYPETPPSEAELLLALQQTERKMRARYLKQQQQITARLQQFEQQLNNPAAWWNRTNEQAALQPLHHFIENIRSNFLASAPVWRQIRSERHCTQRLRSIAEALHHYPQDREAWAQLLRRR